MIKVVTFWRENIKEQSTEGFGPVEISTEHDDAFRAPPGTTAPQHRGTLQAALLILCIPEELECMGHTVMWTPVHTTEYLFIRENSSRRHTFLRRFAAPLALHRASQYNSRWF